MIHHIIKTDQISLNLTGLNLLISLGFGILPCLSKKILTHLPLKYVFSMRDKLSPEMYTCILIHFPQKFN